MFPGVCVTSLTQDLYWENFTSSDLTGMGILHAGRGIVEFTESNLVNTGMKYIFVLLDLIGIQETFPYPIKQNNFLLVFSAFNSKITPIY